MISNFQITSSGSKIQETTTYLVTTLFRQKIDFTLDVYIDDQSIGVELMNVSNEQLTSLFENLSRAYRNKFIGIVHLHYEIDLSDAEFEE